MLPTPSQGLPAAQVQADCLLLEVGIAFSATRTRAWALQEVAPLQCLGKSRADLFPAGGECCITVSTTQHTRDVQWHGLCLCCSGGVCCSIGWLLTALQQALERTASSLQALQQREEAVRNGKLATIVFVRDKNAKGQEVSGYIDYGHRQAPSRCSCPPAWDADNMQGGHFTFLLSQ